MSDPAAASDMAWKQLGPEAGGVLTIVISPHSDDVVYAGTSSGVFKSLDGGQSWKSSGLAGEEVLALAVDPTTAARVYAGTGNSGPGTGGVFASIDGGDSWSEARSGLENRTYPETSPHFRYRPVTSLLVDQQDPNTVWAGTGDNYGLFKSSDGAATWSRARFTDDVMTMAAHPNDSDVFFVGLQSDGLYRTLDSGMTWSRIATEMRTESPNGVGYNPSVFSISVSRADPEIVFATTADELFKSIDGGESWQSLGGLPSTMLETASVVGVATDPRDPDAAFAATWFDGVFRTRDGGASWEQIGEGLECDSGGSGTTHRLAGALAISLDTSRLLLGTRSEGVYLRTAGEGPWEESNTGLFATEVFSVAANPHDPAQLIAAVRELGLQKSFDGGESWATANIGSREACRVPEVDPWTGPNPDCFVRHRVEWLSDDNKIFIAGECGVSVSYDEGETWDDSRSPGYWVDAFAVAPGDSQQLYVAQPRSVKRSLDGGLTWSQCPASPIDNGSFRSLAVSPEDASVVIAGTTKGLYTSHDGCSSWNGPAPEINARCPSGEWTVVDAIEYAPHPRALVYAGTSCGVFASHDGGDGWHHLGLESLDISALAFGRGEIFAGTRGDGVWASGDRGATWARISDDDDNPFVNEILVDPTMRKLYVSSDGNGISVLDRSLAGPRRPDRRISPSGSSTTKAGVGPVRE